MRRWRAKKSAGVASFKLAYPEEKEWQEIEEKVRREVRRLSQKGLSEGQRNELESITETFKGATMESWEEGKDWRAITSTTGEIEGVLQFELHVDGIKYLEILNLATRPKNLRWSSLPGKVRGVGTAGILAVIREARNEKVESVVLYSTIEAIPFYQKLGFAQIEEPTKMKLSKKQFVEVLSKYG